MEKKIREPKMELSIVTQRLDDLFDVKKLQSDPAMARFIPMVYDPIGFDWKSEFQPDFVTRFNGLMLKGSDKVSAIFCAVFPTPEVLERFIAQSQEGDMLFLHHPIDMQCGDPRGELGKGFQPIAPETIKTIKAKKLSVYSCHAPMDYHKEIGTNVAIAAALGAKVIDEFLPYGNGYAGNICEVSPLSTKELIDKAKNIFNIPYVDFAGAEHDKIQKIAVVAGGGTDVEDMAVAEQKGAQCYLSGEIINRIDNDYARNQRDESEKYAKRTKMSLIGVSHSASEFLVMKTQMTQWLKKNLGVRAVVIPQERWWR